MNTNVTFHNQENAMSDFKFAALFIVHKNIEQVQHLLFVTSRQRGRK